MLRLFGALQGYEARRLPRGDLGECLGQQASPLESLADASHFDRRATSCAGGNGWIAQGQGVILWFHRQVLFGQELVGMKGGPIQLGF